MYREWVLTWTWRNTSLSETFGLHSIGKVLDPRDGERLVISWRENRGIIKDLGRDKEVKIVITTKFSTLVNISLDILSFNYYRGGHILTKCPVASDHDKGFYAWHKIVLFFFSKTLNFFFKS